MKSPFTLAFLTFLLWGWSLSNDPWRHKSYATFDVYYQKADRKTLKDDCRMLTVGIDSVRHFMGGGFPRSFDVYIHPDRASLDQTWQKDWQSPDFHSECWMVASGVASKLDLLSPRIWDQAACEHRYADRQATQQLITHELVHVYHGQHNPSPDFSQTEGIDWLVEGLATYASGQCDATRITAVRNALQQGETPRALDAFWKGKNKYGLSGSLVQFIDRQYGRPKLLSLLPLQTKAAVLSALGLTEPELLQNWQNYVLSDEALK